MYGASEAVVAINLWPKEEQFLVLPRAAFYEFIPIEDSHQDQPDTLLLHQVFRIIT